MKKLKLPITNISIEELLQLKKLIPVVDVRSAGEFEHAHICKANSIPIFNNEERKLIGTAYKQESRERAIKIGLEIFGKNLLNYISEFEKITPNKNEIIVHCWRGGMRSSAMAWLLNLYGYKVYLLSGGYKNYRHWVLQQFEKNYSLKILSGCTGSNKTGALHELKNQNELVIDLEGIAKHKGSAFGNLDELPQPSQEQFESDLAEELFPFINKVQKTIWIEGESQRIGRINVPKKFYENMLSSSVLQIEIPFEERLKHILHEYGNYDSEKIEQAILRITKKLGGLETKNAIQFLQEKNLEKCYEIILKYYDRLYKRSAFTNTENKNAQTLALKNTNAQTNAQLILSQAND